MVLRTSNDGPVRLLQLDRPQARNALSAELVRALHSALLQADEDPTVAVVVLHGSDPAFCAGVDLKEAARDGARYFDVFLAHNCVALVGELATPVIGAINGAAFTGGLELALGCDVLVASERAVFADTHVRAGVLPGGGLTVRLPRAVGQQWARRMSMTGEVLNAAEAMRIGLVTEVVPHGDLLPRALELAHAVAAVAPELMGPLRAMYAASDVGLDMALAAEEHLAAAHRIDYGSLSSLLVPRRDSTGQLHTRSAEPGDEMPRNEQVSDGPLGRFEGDRQVEPGIPPGSTP